MIDKNFTLSEISISVQKYLNVSASDFNSKKRNAKILNARKIYCFLAREHSGKSYPEIAKFINVTHANVMHHANDVHYKMLFETNLKIDVENIILALRKKPFLRTLEVNLFPADGNKRQYLYNG